MATRKVYDDSNYKELIGDGKTVEFAGETRLLSAMPKPFGHDTRRYSMKFSEKFPLIPRSEWSARIKEQREKKARVSDYQKFRSTNQGSRPTCWAAGPSHSVTTMRVMQGLPLQFMSPCAIAVPISGGNRGGYEGEAFEKYATDGGVREELWGPTDGNSRLDDNPEVQADRLRHKVLEIYECETFDDWATAALMPFPGAMAYNWWSHVISNGDLIEIEKNSFGLRNRNNWGDDYGDKNDYGFGGYLDMREGRGTPSSGFVIRQVTSSPI